jgi:hypothetical protein
MNRFGHFEQAAVTTIAVQFPYALSYGEFSWQQKSVRAVAKPFSRITKSQLKHTALPQTVSGSGDNSGIERSNKATLNTVTTRIGFNGHGRIEIQIWALHLTGVVCRLPS